MKEYTVLDAKGHVVRVGMCESSQFAKQAANPGETVVEGQRPWTVTQPDYSWNELRRQSYPGYEVFADALYWQDKGDKTKMTAYFAAVAAVKAQYPKPQ